MPGARIFAVLLLVAAGCATTSRSPTDAQPAAGPKIPQWGVFEIAINGPSDGNPFVDVDLSAKFTHGDAELNVRGFYDGAGIYRIRFMPPFQGQWDYTTASNRPELDGKTGTLVCADPDPGNHGPVRVRNIYHFAYADGAPFKLIGTTVYGLAQWPDDVEEQTIATLKSSPFNKVRMLLPPKRIVGLTDKVGFPFERRKDGTFDYTRYSPACFQHYEKRIAQLGAMGIEADVILFHPYDPSKFGFNHMGAENDDRYLRYVVARLGAYHNVWWSMANEFDFIRGKSDADWDRIFQVVQAEDPYGHLRSIHNAATFYDSNKPWVTHMSVQNGAAVADFGRATLYRDAIRKPIVFDEAQYEGDLDRRWGQLTAQEMVMRFWLGTIAGTYVGHGEVKRGHDPAWTAGGSTLQGTSPPRLAFLKSILMTSPPEGIDPIDQYYESHMGGKAGQYYLVYFGTETPAQWTFELYRLGLKNGMTFHVDVIDTWNMTITPVEGTFKVVKKDGYYFKAEGDKQVRLPGRAYMALRIERVSANTTGGESGPSEE